MAKKKLLCVLIFFSINVIADNKEDLSHLLNQAEKNSANFKNEFRINNIEKEVKQHSEKHNKDYGVNSIKEAIKNNIHNSPNDLTAEISNAKKQTSKRYLFVTTGMTESLLVDLSNQAKEHDVILVMRGLKDNSYKAHMDFMIKFVKESENSILIHPDYFKRFNIGEEGPVLVVEDDTGKYDKLTGAVKIDFALKEIEKYGETNK